MVPLDPVRAHQIVIEKKSHFPRTLSRGWKGVQDEINIRPDEKDNLI